MNAFDLYCKPIDYKFSKEEVDFLMEEVQKYGLCAYYAFYRKKSKYNTPISFIIDRMSRSVRKSLVMNNYEVVASRDLSEDEIREQAQNFGCNNRRFTSWNYENIQQVMEEDAKYDVVTPLKFVKECKKRGYAKAI